MEIGLSAAIGVIRGKPALERFRSFETRRTQRARRNSQTGFLAKRSKGAKECLGRVFRLRSVLCDDSL